MISGKRPTPPPVKDRRIIMLLILTGILMFVLDGSVVNIALPSITRYFNSDMSQSQWVITSYLLTTTSLLMIFGKVSEYTGRIRLFLAGFVIFTLSSLACGLSTSLAMLVFFRAVQAVGAAMAFSISAAVIFEIYPSGEQGRAMGYIGTTVSIGSIAGPMLGGYLVDFFGWQYIFLVNLPIGIVLLALAARHMRIEETRSKYIQMDWIGATFMILFVASLMLLLTELTKGLVVSTIAIALVCLASLLVFIINESRHQTPLLDLSICKEKKFVLPIISVTLLIVSSFALFILGPFYFQGVMGYTPSMVGTVFLIVPAIMTFGSPLGGWIYDKYHYKYNSAIGMLIVAASLTLAGYGTRRADLPAILASFVLMGLGSALVQSPMNTEIMNALPRNLLGTASSFSSAVRYLGMAMGVSVSSTLLSIQLRIEGYNGSVLDARPDLLSATISNVMVMAAVLCAIGTITATLRNREQLMN